MCMRARSTMVPLAGTETWRLLSTAFPADETCMSKGKTSSVRRHLISTLLSSDHLLYSRREGGPGGPENRNSYECALGGQRRRLAYYEAYENLTAILDIVFMLSTHSVQSCGCGEDQAMSRTNETTRKHILILSYAYASVFTPSL